MAGLAFVWWIAGEGVPPFLRLHLVPLGGAIAALLAAVLIDSVRLKLLVAAAGARLALWEATRLVLLYAFMSAATLTSLGGESGMVLTLARRGVPAEAAILATSLRTLVPVLVLLVMLPAASAAVPLSSHPALTAGIAATSITALALLVAVCILIWVRIRRPRHAASTSAFGAQAKALGLLGAGKDLLWNCVDSFVLTLKGRPLSLAAAAALTCAHLLAQFSIAPLSAAALGHAVPFWDCVLAVAVVQLATLVVPAPGGSGVSEAAAGVALKALLPSAALLPTVLLWRVLSSYTRIAAGAVAAAGELHAVFKGHAR